MSAEDLVGSSKFIGTKPDGTIMYENSGNAADAFGRLNKDNVMIDMNSGVQSTRLPGGGGAVYNPNAGQIRITTPDSPDIIVHFPH